MPTTTEHHRVSRDQQHRTSYASSFVRWLQVKNYQYEVTFSLYMLTRTEKIIFNIILVILFSLLITAASMYLPNHVALIYNRIWYYVHGGLEVGVTRDSMGGLAGQIVKTVSMQSRTSRVVAQTADPVLRKMGEL